MNEVWNDIEGYEGKYQISNFGRVKSLNYHRGGTEQILKAHTVKGGYLSIGLCKNGKCTNYCVHRLVAKAFIPNPDNLPEINHKDETPSNNCAENLEWCSSKYNNNYGHHKERVAKAITGKYNNRNSKPVIQYTLKGEFVKEYPSIKEVERNTGFNNSNICGCCNGKRKTAHKYIWKYKE